MTELFVAEYLTLYLRKRSTCTCTNSPCGSSFAGRKGRASGIRALSEKRSTQCDETCTAGDPVQKRGERQRQTRSLLVSLWVVSLKQASQLRLGIGNA